MVNFLLNISDINKWKQWFSKWFLVVTLLFLYIPLVLFILLSFNEPSTKGNVASSISSWNGIDNYIKFFSDLSFKDPLINSLIIAASSIPFSLFIGLLTSISIWKNYGKGKTSTFFSCNVVISSPDIVQAIAFSILFVTLVVPLGINLGFFTVILTHIALQIPYVILFLYPRLNKLNRSLLYAAYDLNFNYWESIFNVLIPILFPSIIGATLLAFTVSFDDYIITNLVRGSVVTLSTELYSMKTGIKSWASVFGSLVIMFVVFIIVLFNLFKSIKEKKYDFKK